MEAITTMRYAPRRLAADNTYRSCSRCGKELTDPASRESGVGPECRRKDTHLYAKNIPANFAVATIHALSLKLDALDPECHAPWLKARKSLLAHAEKAQNLSPDAYALKLRGQDLREIIRVLDFLCSFSHPGGPEVRRSCREMILALGYIGLAGVIGGEASTSPAKLYVSNGRIYLECLGNKSGWLTMKKIPGIVTPRYRGDRAPYSAPAGECEAFISATQRHWPMYEGDLTQIRKECVAWVASHLAPLKPSEDVSVVLGPMIEHNLQPAPASMTVSAGATITLRSADFTLAFPWARGRDTYGLLSTLKAIPSKERNYDPVTKVWSFFTQHLPTVQEAVKKWDGSGVTTEPVVSLPLPVTPEDTYKKKPYNGPKRAWRPYRGYRRY